MSEKPLRWNGRTIRTYEDLVSVMHAIYQTGDKDVARAFVATAVASQPDYVSTIGFATGEWPFPEVEQVQELFGVEHPAGDISTPDKAFEAGYQMGERENQRRTPSVNALKMVMNDGIDQLVETIRSAGVLLPEYGDIFQPLIPVIETFRKGMLEGLDDIQKKLDELRVIQADDGSGG